MSDVWVVGVGATRFSRAPERTLASLAEEAVRAALSDAGVAGSGPQAAWFGCCASDVWGQGNIRGQVVLGPMLDAGELSDGLPVVNVEGGCATGALTLHSAATAVRARDVDVALAVGVDKTFTPQDPRLILSVLAAGGDCLDTPGWLGFVTEQALRAGLSFEPNPKGVPFLDVHALLARFHMDRHGTTVGQLGAVAVKNHRNGSANKTATGRQRTLEEVLEDRTLSAPLTRTMCASLTDGAAAAVVVSDAGLAQLAPRVRARAVRLVGSGLAGGRRAPLGQPNVSVRAAEKAYARAGLGPEDVGVAEVHDATAICELVAIEALGFCPEGQAGRWVESGAAEVGGSLPVNPSGGLIAKGHPLAATGLGMVFEVVRQLRGEAGPVQVEPTPRVGVVHNAGGMRGIDEALAAVLVLEGCPAEPAG